MNLAKRSLYFLVGMSIGTVIVLFIAKQKKIEFPYGPDARTLKSIRVKEQRFFPYKLSRCCALTNWIL